MKNRQTLSPADFVEIKAESARMPVRIELAYARGDNRLFGERIYREEARFWLHRTLAEVVEQAARAADDAGYRLVLYDGLRTTTAQAKMLETRAVKDHPHWLEEPRLLSPSGAGAHPRGMAVDVSIETLDGRLLDMGTPFDFLSADPSPEGNPAHRAYKHPQEIVENRKILDGLMLEAAEKCGVSLLPLPQEWWDFRLPPEIYDPYEPLSDEDLSPAMKMCD